MKITILAVSLVLVATTTVASELTLFEHDNFNGRRFTVRDVINNLGDAGFNDKASSAVVGRGTWQLCDDAYFRGNCVTLQPGQYPSLRAMGINDRISSARELGGWVRRHHPAVGTGVRGYGWYSTKAPIFPGAPTWSPGTHCVTSVALALTTVPRRCVLNKATGCSAVTPSIMGRA